MGKILKASSARHEPSPFIRDFSSRAVTISLAELPRHLTSFPKEWPFPRGDLNHWIDLLNRFEEVLELFVKHYELDSGPQTAAFGRAILLQSATQSTSVDDEALDRLDFPSDGDRVLVECVLNFTALLFDNCSNRSLYRSSDRLGSILNTASISLLHANLGLCLRLAKRFHTTRTRQNNSSSQLPQLLKDQFDVNLEHMLKIALPFSRLQISSLTTKHTPRGKDRRSSAVDSALHPSDLAGFMKAQQDDARLQGWLSINYSTRAASTGSSAPRYSSPEDSASQPASPSAHRSLVSNARESPEQSASTISISRNRLQAPTWDVFVQYSDSVPSDGRYDLLHRLRIAKAMQYERGRQQLVSMRLLAVAILAFVHGDHAFQQKVSTVIAEEPRAFQLPHQLSELLQPQSSSGIDVPIQLQTVVILTLEALCMQKSINTNVYSALSANVSHGVLFFVIRKAVVQLNETDDVDENGSVVINQQEEDWRSALFELLRTIPHAAARAAENLFAAGVLDILNDVLRIRTPKALRTQHKIVTFLDNFIHSVRESIGPYVSSNGLETVAELVAFVIDDAGHRLSQGRGLPEAYRSRGAEYEIPFYHQSTIKVCLKLLSHMMMHQNGNFNRHIWVLFDSRAFVAALNKVLQKPLVFGAALWSGVLNFMSEFLNNEPTSYSIVAESQLNETFLKILSTRIELPSVAATQTRAIENWVKLPQQSILAATDAMTAIPAAISALCLNEAGIRQFQAPDLFSNFLEIFESPAHLHTMESESMDIPVALGRSFDELVRHHPSPTGGLRKPITTAVVRMAEKVISRAQAEAEAYGFGAKLYINSSLSNGSNSLVVSGGKEALGGKSGIASASTPMHTNGDVHMGDLPALDVSRPVTEDVVEQNKASPTPMAMIFNTLRFLAAFCTNQTTRQSFVDAGGVKLILNLITSPAAPTIYQIGDPSIVNSVSKLLQHLMEDRPWLIVPAMLHRLNDALVVLEPMYHHDSQEPFFKDFTTWTSATLSKSATGAQTNIASLDHGTSYIKALLKVRTLTEVLAIVFQNQSYNHRPQTSLFVAANYADLYITVIDRLGHLQRSCAWEELQMILDPSLPKAMLEGIRTHRGRVTNHLLFAEDILVDHGIAVPEVSVTTTGAPSDATNGTAAPSPVNLSVMSLEPAPNGTHINNSADGSGPQTSSETFEGHNTAQCKNITVLRNVFQEIFLSIGSFTTSLSRILVARRGQDSYSRQNAQKVAAQIAMSTIDQLNFGMPLQSSSIEKRYAYWVTILSNAYSLFVDESASSPHTMTLFIQSFKQQGGFEVLEQMMDKAIAARDISPKAASDTTTVQNYLKGVISLILDIFGPIVVAKNVTESPQSQALVSRSTDRTRSDYFKSEQFLVELRLLAMRPIMKLWPTGKGDDDELIRGQIDILRPILEGDGETGAFTKNDAVVIKSKTTPKKWVPRSSEAVDILSAEFGSELAREALFRCNDSINNARSYAQTFVSTEHNEFLRNPIPLLEVSTTNSQQDIQHDSNSLARNDQAPATESSGNTNQTPQTLSGQIDTDHEEEDVNEDDDEAEDDEDDGSEDDEVEVGPESSATSQELLEPIIPPTVDELEEKRTEIRASLIDRCLELLDRHDNLPFELRDLVAAACKSKSFLSHKDVGPTVLTSVVSLQPDDNLTAAETKAHWKKLAAYSLFLALILQMKEFYEAAKEHLLEHLDVLLGLMKHNQKLDTVSYGDVASHILLVLEFLFQDDMSPRRVSWHPPQESDPIDTTQSMLQIEKPILDAEQRETIFDAVMEVVQHVADNTKLAMAVTRALVALTRQRNLAVKLSEKKNLQRLFSMIKQIGGGPDPSMQHNLLLILRHIIEDDKVLRQIMRSEIQATFETRGRQQFETTGYCRNLSHLALRAPQIFLEVSKELVHITKYDSHHQSQMLGLKQSKSDASSTSNKPSEADAANLQAAVDAPSDPMEMSVVALDTSDADRAKVSDLRMPVNDVSDGLIHFMLGELINYKDVEDAEVVSTSKNGDSTGGDGASISGGQVASEVSAPDMQLPPFSLVFDDDKQKPRSNFKPEQNRIYLYRCFLLQSLTELLSSYTKAKIDFINFRRRPDAVGSTPSKPRSLVLNYLLQNLIPVGIVSHPEEDSSKKKEAISQWASHVVNGLCAKTFEVLYRKQESSDTNPIFDLDSWEEEPELIYVRKYVLEQSIKAFREAVSSTEPADVKYSRILKLADLFYRLLVQKAQTSAVAAANVEMLQLSQKMLAKIMYEKGFIATLTSAISEVDLTHPGAKRVVKYLLRPLKQLTDVANDLSINSGVSGPTEGADVEEFLSDSVDSDVDDRREETPDLFRNSALGILAGGAESESDSDDAMDEDEMYDEYMDEDYDEEMAYEEDEEDLNHDPEEIVSDEDEDMTGIEDPVEQLQAMMGGVESSSGEDDDEDDEDIDVESDSDDEDDEDGSLEDDHESIEEGLELEHMDMEGAADEQWTTESQDDDEEDEEDGEGPIIHEFRNIPIIQRLQDLENGISHLNHLTMLEGMTDPPGHDTPDFDNDPYDIRRADMSPGFEDGEMDEGEDDFLDEYEEDIVYEPEGDDEDEVDIFEATAPSAAFVPFIDPTMRRGHHHGHLHHHHSSNLREQFGSPHGGPAGMRTRPSDGSNPLLQRQHANGTDPMRPQLPGSDSMLGGLDQFFNGMRPFPGSNDAPQQQLSFINNIMHLITHGGGTHMPPSHNGHAVRVQINNHDGSMLVRHRTGGRHGALQPAPNPRDDPLTASHFTVSVTASRWQEEARILFGAVVAEKAGYLVNALHEILVPAAREQQREEAARQKRMEEEKLEQERKDRDQRELKKKQERDQAERQAEIQKAASEAAAAAALAEAAASHQADPAEGNDSQADMGTVSTAADADDDRMSGVEGTNVHSSLEVEEVPPPPEVRVPVMRMLGGNQIDIAALGIDTDFFDALPPDMQEETFMMQVVTQRSEVEVSGAEATDFDAEFLAALPAEMREEILQTSRQERRRREREAERRRVAASAPAGNVQAEDMDLPNFLASLENRELRRSILMDADEDLLRQLPADLVAEARQYSRILGNRPFRTEFTSVGSQAYPPSGLTRPDQPDRPRKPHQYVQILDKANIAVLLRLLFLQQSGSLRGSFQEILSAICYNKQNRAEVVSIILSILQDTGNDISMDKTLAHLLARAKQSQVSKTPQAKKSAVDIVQHTELSPATVAKNCLDTLSQLTINQKVVEFFLSEHETSAASKPKTPRKSKGKDTKSSRFPINALLGLLDKKIITENAALTENLAVLLQVLTAPLSAMAKKKQDEELAAKSAQAATNDEAVAQPIQADVQGATTGVPAAASSADDTSTTEQPAAAIEMDAATDTAPTADNKKSRGVTEPPEITDHNLRLVINIIAARECSSRAFQKTLTLMMHLASSVPNAMSIFGQELTRQAQDLGRNILQDLRDLLQQIREAKSGHEVQGVAIAKFSPASSDQTKLLRVIKALSYVFDPSRTLATAGNTAENDKVLHRLYENDTFGPLWETLSSCLVAVQERGNMMNVATILLPLIEVLMVVCQNQTPPEVVLNIATPGIQTAAKESFLSHPANDSSPNISQMFLKFTEDHKKVLNELVRNNPKLMSGSFSVLVKNSKVLEFDNKRNYFQRKLHAKESQNGSRPSHPSLHINVHRNSTFLDSFRSLFYKRSDEFKYGKLNVRFQGEEGVDAGGLTREWFQVLVQQIFNPNYALFNPMASDRLTYHPNPLSNIHEVHLSYFQFVGRIIGKAMYESRPLDCHFSRAVYKRMLGLHVGVKDMEAHDPSYYGSLKYILENKLEDGMIGDFTFAAETERFGEIKIEDLIPNGRNIAVTDENKREYVRLIVEHKLVTSVKDQLDSFLKGFHDIIPADIISIFTEQELELLISGLPEIDVDDWKNNTEYSGYTASSPQIVWFWRMVRSFDKEQRAKLLQFVTGTSKVPLNGFKELEGMNGFSRFAIHRDYTSDRLPSAHTCFNQLDLPEYDSYEKLRDTLLLAITDGSGEFGFA